MKKIIFIFLFLPVIVQSQNWYPIGATWYYNKQELLSFPANGYTKYTVVKDTVVDSKPSKLVSKEVVKYTGDTISVGSLIIREENSKAYYYYNNAFQLMYDFTLNVGDTLDIDISSTACDSVSPLIVDSIKNINISGTNIQVQYVKGIYYINQTFGGQIDTVTFPIIEKVGGDIEGGSFTIYNLFFNPICQVGDVFAWDGLRCYNDSNISYKGGSYHNQGYPYPCDTLINGTTGLTELSNNENIIEFFPNPSEDFITIKAVSAINNIEVYDYCGKFLTDFQPESNEITVNIESYPQGVYLFVVRGENIFTKYFKLIKT